MQWVEKGVIPRWATLPTTADSKHLILNRGWMEASVVVLATLVLLGLDKRLQVSIYNTKAGKERGQNWENRMK